MGYTAGAISKADGLALITIGTETGTLSGARALAAAYRAAVAPHVAIIDPDLAAEGARLVEGMRTAKPNGLARVFYASNAPGEHLGCLPPTALRIEMISEDGKPRWFYPTWLDTLEQASRAADWLNDRGITTTRDALRKLIQTDDEFDAIKPAPVDA